MNALEIKVVLGGSLGVEALMHGLHCTIIELMHKLSTCVICVLQRRAASDRGCCLACVLDSLVMGCK